jgi:hypothetical protein
MELSPETQVVSNTLSLVFVGHGGMGSNALSLYKGLTIAVKDSRMVDTRYFDTPPRFSLRRVLRRLLPNIYGRIASKILELLITKLVRDVQPDIFMVFKGNYVNYSTLKKIHALKVHYHPDDSTNDVNRTSIFHKAEMFYDVHFTSKRHNVPEIIERTKKNVHFIWYAYDQDWHFRKMPLNFHSPRYLLGFIGHMRADRIDLINRLANQYGKNFAITGLNWRRIPDLRQKASLFPPAYGEKFSAFIAESPIQLGLLNSDNRDQHTARSFEIPAAGGLLIAEDTPDHRELFGTGENALFFNGVKDLEQILAWVKSHPKEATEIAENGFQHITSNQNTWLDRSFEILSKLISYL